MIKHFLHYLMFGMTMFAAAAPPLTGGSDAGAGTGGAPAPGGTPASDSGAGQGAPAAGQGTQPAGSEGLRQLRETYENLKKDFEPWQKLNIKPEQVGQFQGVYSKLHQEVASIGRELGYPDEEIAEAMAEDPVRTLDFLRNEAAKAQENRQQAGGQQDLNELVQQHIEQAIGPIQQRENFRMTNEAQSLFERTVHQLATESFQKQGIDYNSLTEDEKFFISTGVSEVMKYDEGALRDLKYQGKTAGVQRAFQEFFSALDKYYLARSGRERSKLQPGRPGVQAQPQNGNGKKPTLDEMINDPSVINEKYR